MEAQRWSVEFYVDARGKSPIQEFVERMQARERVSVARAIDLLTLFGPRLGMPHARQVEGKLWELRAGSGRLFYFLYIERRVIILHGYQKKSQRAPTKEIETGLRRMNDFLRRETNGG